MSRSLAASPPMPVATAKRRVLVADDDDILRAVMVRVLERAGYEVVEACDGAAALAEAARCVPDLALIDLQMPVMSGLEVVRELKSMHASSLPVLVLSGAASPEDRIAAFDVGADDFIAKPVQVPELVRRLDAFERARRAYQEVRLANERADRLRVFAAEAAALLAHDLNNGLSVAMANLQYVDEVSELDAEPREAVKAATSALHRMAGLVRNFVDISRLEDAAIVPERTRVRVADLLTTVAEIHETTATQAGVVVEVDCDSEAIALIDPVLIERVTHNLVGNAVRYVNPGGRIRLRARIRRSLPFPDQPMLTLEVSNTGPTIPADKRATLFEKYGTGRDRSSQCGMGLYFCRLACEAHGGSLSLESEAQFPTTFAARMPV